MNENTPTILLGNEDGALFTTELSKQFDDGFERKVTDELTLFSNQIHSMAYYPQSVDVESDTGYNPDLNVYVQMHGKLAKRALAFTDSLNKANKISSRCDGECIQFNGVYIVLESDYTELTLLNTH